LNFFSRDTKIISDEVFWTHNSNMQKKWNYEKILLKKPFLLFLQNLIDKTGLLFFLQYLLKMIGAVTNGRIGKTY